MTATQHRLFTVSEYHCMTEYGILHPEERVELLEGEIINMAAKNPAHSAVTKTIQSYLEPLFAGLALVRVQDPIQLSDRSEPEPDIALVKLDENYYYDRHPTAADTYLIVEVADTTLKYDTTKKVAAYAKSGIKDYCVVDVIQRRIFFYTSPQNNEYLETTVTAADVILSVAAFPDISLETAKFFPVRL